MADMLRLSEATALGLHAMAIVAGQERAISVVEAAKQLDASAAHLSKVMQQLAKSGFLQAKRGPNGGYTLARPASEITLLAVYEALEGSLRLDGCLFAAPVCQRAHCILGGLVERVRTQIHEHFEATTLADLAERQGR
ncbi:Rrf2 family transcriptional regulator [Candidatus Bipolaricaulota bacterium]|nr:Rrf2 family transcriptional regulator [Candidatus Bipolaricaulota bacterium]